MRSTAAILLILCLHRFSFSFNLNRQGLHGGKSRGNLKAVQMQPGELVQEVFLGNNILGEHEDMIRSIEKLNKNDQYYVDLDKPASMILVTFFIILKQILLAQIIEPGKHVRRKLLYVQKKSENYLNFHPTNGRTVNVTYCLIVPVV